MDFWEILKNYFLRIIYDSLKWFITTKLLNPDSRLYYKRMFEKLQIVWLAIQLYVIFFFLKRFVFSSLFRSSNKDMEFKITVLGVLAIIIIAAAVMSRASQNRKELAV